ncbi:MAG: DUF4013 domain-containing protein [Atopobiaceae bacterium]
MAQNQTDGAPTRQGHYLSRSWALLTQQKGWIKPMLVMSVARFVPVFGDLGINGYALEWGRLTAWNVDAAPKQKNVKVGKLISSGWRGFLVGLVWVAALCVAYWIVNGLLSLIPHYENSGWSDLVDLAFFVGGLIWSVMALVAQLRATIYERLGTGFRLDRIFQMFRRDFGDLWRVVGIDLLGGLIAGAVVAVFGIALLGMLLPSIVSLVENVGSGSYGMMYGYGMSNGMDMSTWMATQDLLHAISSSIPALVLMLFCLNLVHVIFRMLTTTATALWMRQFDVPRWGTSSDPLPQDTAPSSGAPQLPMAPAGQAPQTASAAAPGATPAAAPSPVQQPAPNAQQSAQPAESPAPAAPAFDVSSTPEAPHAPVAPKAPIPMPPVSTQPEPPVAPTVDSPVAAQPTQVPAPSVPAESAEPTTVLGSGDEVTTQMPAQPTTRLDAAPAPAASTDVSASAEAPASGTACAQSQGVAASPSESQGDSQE